ncbi:MAG TPA: SRPBCC family protein [Solirubrobacterales bacterium]|nr:SRPBCC family protein [Solirubrobacterales bacterium]
MRIEQDFEVPAAPPEVYELLVNLERVGPCIPGGEVGRREDDGWHPTSIAVRLGPMRMNYRGQVRIESRDDAARRAVLAADLREQRGQGTATAKMTMAVAASGTGALVESVTDVRLTGRAGQMGRGVVDDVAVRLVAEMAACIAARFAPVEGAGEPGGAGAGPPERAKPISGLRLMARVLWERLKRAFRRRGGETHA